MSVNLTVTIPFSVFQAIQAAADSGEATRDKTISAASAKAVVAAAQALQPKVQDKEPDAFEITVSDVMKGVSKAFLVEARTTVAQLKKMIQGLWGIPEDMQRLVCNGKQLEDGYEEGEDETASLHKNGIGPGTPIYLVTRLRGS